MAAKLNPRWNRPLFAILILLAGTLACTQCGPSPNQPAPAEPTATIVPEAEAPTPTPTPQVTTIEGPEGLVLALEGQALTEGAEVRLEVLREDGLSTEGTPFRRVGPAFRIGFENGDQIGGMILKIPLGLLPEMTLPPEPYRFAGWARPDRGYPSLVGVLIDEDAKLVSLPIVGAGEYQILRIARPVVADLVIHQPLAVPTYWQAPCGWCSTTAITDVAAYHEGAWPSGGYGGAWGESSNWYLAGLGGQSCPKGYFFHWLLKAGGYTTPGNVKQSFIDGNAEVIIWNWTSAKMDEWDLNAAAALYPIWTGYSGAAEYILSRLEYTVSLFQFFHAYVETNLWGQNGDRRPVAWGSALASHSRVITGSDGESFFFNNPSSGSLNDSKTWDDYLQEVVDSIQVDAEHTEIIDTAIFYAPPRPANERRGVLWLTPRLENSEGSVILRRGEAGTPAAYWIWDGSNGHTYGYYYEDQIGDLPADPILGVQFKAMTPDDVVEYGFNVRSVSDANYGFRVDTELYSETGKVGSVTLPYLDGTLNAGGRKDIYPAASFPIGNLAPGLYHLKHTLSMGGTVQDVKYVFFMLAERGYTPRIPVGTLQQNALCRKGPGTAYGAVTGFEAGRRLTLVGVDTERRWGLFEAEVSGDKFRCWMSLNLLELEGDTNVPVFAAPPTQAGPVCQRDVSQETCAATGGTWKFTLAGVGYCECP